MRIKLLTTEADRQRLRKKILVRFFGLMFLVLVLFGALVGGRYIFGL